MRRRPVSQTAQLWLRQAFGWACAYCRKIFPEFQRSAGRFSVDHFIPLSRGGHGRLENLVAACYRCNTRKGNQNSLLWLQEEFPNNVQEFLELRDRWCTAVWWFRFTRERRRYSVAA